LADFLANKISARMGRRNVSISEEAARLLRSYDWPGNVRELENALERALIVAKTSAIFPEDLSLPLEGQRAEESSGTLAEVEKRAILETLARNNGERRVTAQQLGVSLRTLQYRLKQYGLAGKD